MSESSGSAGKFSSSSSARIFSSGGEWRRAVLDRYGSACVAQSTGGCQGRVEAHHVIYRSHGGQNAAENGIPVCSEHHRRIHARSTLIAPEWLLYDARMYLAGKGWVEWDDEGQPFGMGHRGFLPLRSVRHTAMVHRNGNDGPGEEEADRRSGAGPVPGGVRTGEEGGPLPRLADPPSPEVVPPGSRP